jgi:uncharacterized caspase-like protein
MFHYLIVFIHIILFSLLITGCSENDAESKGINSSTSSTAVNLASSSTDTERIALVIGNGDYDEKFNKLQLGKLSNPVYDAKDMAKVLNSLGFEVILKTNVRKKTAMKQAVREFIRRLGKNDVGIFYFSGHGFQQNNINYLLPLRADIHNDIDIEGEALPASYVLRQMERATRGVKLMILDACRLNIPEDFFRKSKGAFSGVSKGFSSSLNAPMNTLIIYATAANQISWGGLPGERNSVYTKHLVDVLRQQPHAMVEILLKEVRHRVVQETQDVDKPQVPWESGSLVTQPFCFGTCGSEEQRKLARQRAEFEKKQAELAQQQLEFEQQRQAELERQRQAESERQRQAELERQRQAELERQRQAELAQQLRELEQQRALLDREKARQQEEAKQADLIRQRQAELAQQRRELEQQRALLEKARQQEQAKQADLIRQREATKKRELAQQLRDCESHFKANRLTTGEGGTALVCYQQVLAKEPSNAKALAGLENIEARYVTWIKRSLKKRQRNKAKQYLASLRLVNPQSSQLAALEKRLSKLYRYIDNGDGTVTDNRSGLIWLKNANCFGYQKWKTAMQSAANLASGQCGLRDGSKRGMWRLPTKDEWKAMIDKKYVDRENWSQPVISNAAGTGPWKEGDAFSGVQSDYYWTATTDASDTAYAWHVNLKYGYVNASGRTFTYYVWPVRGRH